jgi:hypothetical protein
MSHGSMHYVPYFSQRSKTGKTLRHILGKIHQFIVDNVERQNIKALTDKGHISNGLFPTTSAYLACITIAACKEFISAGGMARRI